MLSYESPLPGDLFYLNLHINLVYVNQSFVNEEIHLSCIILFIYLFYYYYFYFCIYCFCLHLCSNGGYNFFFNELDISEPLYTVYA